MKHFGYKRLFGWFAAATLLLTTSCKDEMFGDYGNSDEVTVSFNLAPESAVGTRGLVDEDPNEIGNHISNGAKADLLIYAVYDADGKLLTDYGVSEERAQQLTEQLGHKIAEGQIVMQKAPQETSGTGNADTGSGFATFTSYPATINLTLKRGQKYTVAFWAQSSNTKAYNTENLRKVEVIYSEIENEMDGTNSQAVANTTPNNDEFRDAFCRKETFVAGTGNMEHDVYLYRPLAQINVGTYGYDYETVMRNADKKYRYSKIRVNRVARYLDVYADEVLSSTTADKNETADAEETEEAFSVIDYGYAPIPAYFKLHEDQFKTYTFGQFQGPDYPSYTIWDRLYETYPDHISNNDKEIHQKEEFLYVRLCERDGEGQLVKEDGRQYTDDEYTGYLVWTEGEEEGDLELKDPGPDGYLDYASLGSKYGDVEADYQSETFKYLSMCYVLVPSTMKEEDYTYTVLNNVKVWMATDAQGSDEIEIVNLNNVPAQRNWRTNIIGDLLTTKTKLQVKLDRDFVGEFNAWGPEWNWSGALAKGVYYDDNANDGKGEIQISDVEGLLWFQQMVNGKLRVRVAPDYLNNAQTALHIVNGVKKDDPYRYYTSDGTLMNISDIMNPDGYYTTKELDEMDETLKKRILKATKQGDTWPENNNFHFKDVIVKLMADIDLTGIEWIPIGFDYKVAEFAANDYYDDNDPFKEEVASNRGFYGIFDGNGHTISNLKTKRFSARVDDSYIERIVEVGQDKNGNPKDDSRTPRLYDALPWFGRGLFGSIGGDAEIRNVRLYNVDILGCNGVGGIVGIAYGGNIKIQNCIVDKGTLTATPMYRNDRYNYSSNTRVRTFARGTYLGGIVGYFNTSQGDVAGQGEITGCSVRNLTIKGYRQVGGLVGTIDRKYDTGSNGNDNYQDDKKKNPIISGNSVSNTAIIASQLHFPFGIAPHAVNDDNKKTDRIGFGWDLASKYDLYSGKLLGGDYEEYVSKIDLSGNTQNGVTFSEMTETIGSDENTRISIVQETPLKNMPALSSWFTDEITLHGNYYGEPSAYKFYTAYEFDHLGKKNYYPMQLPMEVEMAWIKKSTQKVGLYVESVTLDGGGGMQGKYSVITPTEIKDAGACMYVTARDRSNAMYNSPYDNQPLSKRKATNISNVILRGNPYAHTGLLLAPNANMSEVTLKNVNIYDVYQTIALDNITDAAKNQWPQSVDPNEVMLNLTTCNLRGYTVPGSGWGQITYEDVTFEQGASTGHDPIDERTCQVDATTKGTTFKKCYFKAPYIINISPDAKVEFGNGKDNECKAIAALSNEVIKLPEVTGATVTSIEIGDDSGRVTITYTMSDGTHYDKDGKIIEHKTEDETED